MQHYHLISSGLVSSSVYSAPFLSISLFPSLFTYLSLFLLMSTHLLSFFPSLFLLRMRFLALHSWFYFHPSLFLFSPQPFSFSTRHLIPHLRDVHSILSHLLEVTRDRPSSHFLWTSAPSFISNSANARICPPASIARLVFARHICNGLEMILDKAE